MVHFYLPPGQWLGEGKLQFHASKEVFHFFTRWEVSSVTEGGIILATQEVQMKDAPAEKMVNRFQFLETGVDCFKVILENEQIGLAQGVGYLKENLIGWEFRGDPEFEGFETYRRQSDQEYLFHAEYFSSEQFRSIINGRIWQKIIS